MIKKKLLILILYLSLIFTGRTWLFPLTPEKAVTQYHVEVWKKGRGLPGNAITCMLQSHDGFIWLGGFDGLFRFDGHRFLEVGPFVGNRIWALYEDNKKRIWIGTDEGLLCLEKGKFIAGIPAKLKACKVKCLEGDAAGNIWMGTSNDGLFCYNTRDGSVQSFTTREGLAHNMVWDVCLSTRGKLWVGTMKGLDLIEKGKITHKSLDNHVYEIYSIFEDRETNLWMGTNDGLIRLKGDAVRLYSEKDGIEAKTILNITRDRDNNIWFGTNAGGVYRLDGETFSAFTTRDGLPDDLVSSMIEDRKGNIWLSAGSGLVRLKDALFTTYSTSEGLSKNMVWCVTEDKKGNLWIGTEGGGLNRLTKGIITPFNAPFKLKNGLDCDTITALCADGRKLLIGTHEGLNSLDTEDTTIEIITAGLADKEITSIYRTNTGEVLVGTEKGELYRLDTKDDTFIPILTGKKALGNRITTLVGDRSGTLWIGTRGGGLSRYKDKTIATYSYADGMPAEYIVYLYQEPDKTLWIGTYKNGLIRLKNDAFSARSKKDGFFSNVINHILTDNDGNFWFSTEIGIFCVEKKELYEFMDGISETLQYLTFTESDGMKNRICNGSRQPAGCKSRDGRLWFPTVKGVTTVNPGESKKKEAFPPVYIEEIIVDNEIVKTAFEPQLSETVEFSPGKENFEFHYTALSLNKQDRLKFKYKLEGYENQWKEVGTRRTAYYTNIMHGSYIFRVAACKPDGTWDKTGTTFKFRLGPHFFQTPWFFVICIAVLLMALKGFVSFRVRKLKTRKAELEKEVEQRTHELAEANHKLSKQAAELENTNGKLCKQAKKLEDANKKLNRQATTDGLTRIYNFRWFSENMNREWRRAIRECAPISIIMVDVDYFKLYNDTYGHQAGDKCLTLIASKLKKHCRRAGDAVARYGGEEFIVILPHTISKDAEELAEKMRLGIQKLNIIHSTSKVKKIVTISLGCVTIIPLKGSLPATLIRAADEALYASKGYGRNRITVRDITEKTDHEENPVDN
ncbi:MAG: diguanylate cyclase [bacterium]|nr:diguanylate cyclase [bacterium]